MRPENLKLSERHDFREFFNHLDGVAMWTAEGDGNLTYLSSGFDDIWGISADDILDDPSRLLDCVHPEDRDHVRSQMELSGPDITQHSIQHRVIRPNGTVRWVDVRVFPIHDAAGDFSELVGVTIDITDQKRRELELEVLNRVLRHDIRNDMNVVLGWLSMLEEVVPDGDREMLDRIQKASQHVVELTDIARNYLEVVAGDEDFDLEPVNVSRVLESELESRQFTYPDASFVVDGPLPDVRVEANELLPSVFRNLLNNGVQHNDKEVPTVVVSVDADPATVYIQVADNGPGVPDELKEPVFGKSDIGPDSPGTGMGLYLCREIVEAYNGSIWVEDNDPDGAIFCVELPAWEHTSQL